VFEWVRSPVTGLWMIYEGSFRQIRIRCHDKSPHEKQLTEIAEIIEYFSEESMAFYTDRKSQIRCLCGSA